jgi:hypothetical protein
MLVKHEKALLDFQGPIYSSRIFVPFFVTAGLIYSAGYVFVGTGIVYAGMLPRVSGYLIAIGAPTFGLGALFGKYQAYPRSFGVTLMSGGLIWLGLRMVA